MIYDLQSEVIIAGAGPAGAATSLFLSKEKIPHIIFDKAKFPRDKVCGDAISGKVIDVLKKLDESFLHEIYESPAVFEGRYGVKFAAPNGNFIDIPFKKDLSELKHAPGFITKRIHFDNFLFEKLDRTYATVLEEYIAKEIQHANGGVEIILEQNGKQLKAFCKLIIGAEGDRSIVAKKFSGIQKEDNHYCAGLRAYYKGVTGFHENGFIELHFLKELLPGYLWLFPLPNGEANVGVGMLSKAVSKKKINLKKEMLNAIKENPTIKERFKNAELVGDIKGWGLPLGSKKRKISGNNFLLTGDAASLIDPFTGEGIGNAMLSGMLAAKHAQQSILKNKFDETTLKEYDKEIYEKLWSELKLSHTMQKLSNYDWLFNFVVNKAGKNEELRNTITCMFDDLGMRDKLRSPQFYFRLLFN